VTVACQLVYTLPGDTYNLLWKHVCAAGLVRAILAEMLGLSASALGSVQVALTGSSDSGAEQPAGASARSRLWPAQFLASLIMCIIA
jgi:hypothetical protein